MPRAGRLTVMPRPDGSGMRPWESLHIHLFDPSEHLLRECLTPLISESATRGEIESFFFVRYMERGPHVRLRLRYSAGCESAHERIGAQVSQYVSQRAREHPAPFAVLQAFEQASSLPIEPNGSVLARGYEPEVQRYGGEAGLALAETIFHQSSRIALAAVARFAPSSPQRAFFGLKLMMTAACAAVADDALLPDYFDEYAAAAASATVGGDDAVAAGALQTANELGYRLRALVGELRQPGGSGEGALRLWAGLLSSACNTMTQIGTSKFLDGAMASGYHGRWSHPALAAAANQTHMMNNRLGIPVAQEVVLARVARDSLRWRGT